MQVAHQSVVIFDLNLNGGTQCFLDGIPNLADGSVWSEHGASSYDSSKDLRPSLTSKKGLSMNPMLSV